jgi:uncharacterized protein
MARYGLPALGAWLLGLLVFISPTHAGPSFSCDGRLNDTELAICQDAELSDLDAKLHNAYTRFMRTQTGADRGGNRDVQVNWLQDRNACGSDTDCIRNAYIRRLGEIASYDTPSPPPTPSRPPPRRASNPSFSCDGRLNETEATICSDDFLADLDVKLHNAYTRFMRGQTGSDRGGNRDVQMNWLQERNACGSDNECIRDAYNRRIREIASYSTPPQDDPPSRPSRRPRDNEPTSVMAMSHNGSTMQMSTDGNNNVVIRYSSPRAGLPVREGTVLFEGTVDANGNMSGTAYTFRRGCDPAGYDVSGAQTNSRIVLRGAAPVRDADSCDIISYDSSDRNSRLVFDIAE